MTVVIHYNFMTNGNECGFWKRVVEELEYQGKERKWLASEAHFDCSTIGTGLKRDGMPHADLAINIAHALKVSVEYLVFGKTENTSSEDSAYDEKKIHKYSNTIIKLDEMPDYLRTPIERMISDVSDTYKSKK